MKTIIIEHDDGGMASGWFLDSVEVKVKNDTTMFPVGRWLDKDEDDGKISLELEPNKKPASKSRAGNESFDQQKFFFLIILLEFFSLVETPKPTTDPNKSKKTKLKLLLTNHFDLIRHTVCGHS